MRHHVTKHYSSARTFGEGADQFERRFFAIEYGSERLGHQIMDIDLVPPDAPPRSYIIGPEEQWMDKELAAEIGTLPPVHGGQGDRYWPKYRSIKDLLERRMREVQAKHAQEIVALAATIAAYSK